jgi:hypothetical protein
MKYKFKKSKPGDTRIIKKFLIYPRCIRGTVKWLQTAYIKQKFKKDWKYKPAISDDGALDTTHFCYWDDVKWTTKSKWLKWRRLNERS